MVNLILLMCCAVMYGYIEQLAYRNGFYPPEHSILNKFSLKYHVPMVVFWLLMCYGFGYWWAIGLFAMVEDASYFAFHPTDDLDRKDWVTMNLGGVTVFGQFIPYTYVLLFAASVGLFWIELLVF